MGITTMAFRSVTVNQTVTSQKEGTFRLSTNQSFDESSDSSDILSLMDSMPEFLHDSINTCIVNKG